jgi:hypothetical protein
MLIKVRWKWRENQRGKVIAGTLISGGEDLQGVTLSDLISRNGSWLREG